MLLVKLILLVFLFNLMTNAQNELVPVNHPVYDLLHILCVKRAIANYDPTIAPLHRSDIYSLLAAAKTNGKYLSVIEREEVDHWTSILSPHETNKISSLIKEQNFNIYEHFVEIDENYFYSQTDSVASFRLSPLLSLDYLKDKSGSAFLFMFGASVMLDFQNYGFSVATTNGLQSGNKTTAAKDSRVAQSYTFNVTGLPNFDQTFGYFYFVSDNFNLTAGRERTLWGNSPINPFLLSQVPQQFDFLKFQFKWKSFSYDYLHGWLVQPTEKTYIDSIIGDAKNKNSKFIAMNRISFSPWENFRIGGSQVIIYANRNLEMAYLTPFLFWESAQRSLGDLDNSFLVLDLLYYPIRGLNLYSTFLLDDINFQYITKYEGNFWQNRWAYQIGAEIAHPLMPENVKFTTEYSVIRPYTLSHTGVNGDLAYTNNGYPLGINMEPNSTLWSTQLSYAPVKNGKITLSFNNYLHGRNIYDKAGKLVENVGGSYFLSTTLFDDSTAILLDGELEVKNSLNLKFNYLLSYLWNFEFRIESVTHKFRGVTRQEFFSTASFRYFFF